MTIVIFVCLNFFFPFFSVALLSFRFGFVRLGRALCHHAPAAAAAVPVVAAAAAAESAAEAAVAATATSGSAAAAAAAAEQHPGGQHERFNPDGSPPYEEQPLDNYQRGQIQMPHQGQPPPGEARPEVYLGVAGLLGSTARRASPWGRLLGCWYTGLF
jgi:hypothetical protein